MRSWNEENGRWVRERLEDRLISIADAARRIEVSYSTMLRWIEGTQSPLHPQSFHTRGFHKLAELLGYRSPTQMLDAMDRYDEIKVRDLSPALSMEGLSVRAKHVFRCVDLRGAAFFDDLTESIGEEPSSGIKECLDTGCLVRERDLDDRSVVYLPYFAIAAELAGACRTKVELSARLGLSGRHIEGLLAQLNEHLEHTPEQSSFCLRPHHYDLIVLDWSNTLVEETAFDDAICEEIASVAGRDRFRQLLDSLEAKRDYRWYDYAHLGGLFDLTQEQILQFHEKHKAKLRWLDHAKNLLQHCSETTSCALATNCARPILEKRMSLAGVSPKIFKKVVTSTETKYIRSKSKHLDVLLRDLGFPPERTLLISDNYDCDVLPALQVGMNAIWFMRSTGPSFWGTPGVPADKDQYAVSLEESGHKKPTFIASSHLQTLAWLQGSPRN